MSLIVLRICASGEVVLLHVYILTWVKNFVLCKEKCFTSQGSRQFHFWTSFDSFEERLVWDFLTSGPHVSYVKQGDKGTALNDVLGGWTGQVRWQLNASPQNQGDRRSPLGGIWTGLLLHRSKNHTHPNRDLTFFFPSNDVYCNKVKHPVLTWLQVSRCLLFSCLVLNFLYWIFTNYVFIQSNTRTCD